MANNPVFEPSPMKCTRCKGTGVYWNEADGFNSLKSCPDCNGYGQLTDEQRSEVLEKEEENANQYEPEDLN